MSNTDETCDVCEVETDEDWTESDPKKTRKVCKENDMKNLGSDVDEGSKDLGEMRNFVAYVVRNDLDEMKNVVYKQRSLCGVGNDNGQTMTLRTRKDSMRRCFDENFVVGYESGEDESQDRNAAVSETFLNVSLVLLLD